jgi:hypothetical protein
MSGNNYVMLTALILILLFILMSIGPLFSVV